MVAAMVLGGLRRCEVLGLRMGDLRVAERRVFIAEGKGGRQRLIPVSGRFFAAVAAYLDTERPPGAGTDRVFVVLKGPRRGQPLSAKGMDVVLAAARRRAGLDHATCHELRHTCLTRLREAGMALEAAPSSNPTLPPSPPRAPASTAASPPAPAPPASWCRRYGSQPPAAPDPGPMAPGSSPPSAPCRCRCRTPGPGTAARRSPLPRVPHLCLPCTY
jgi:hypothetical protein